MKKNKKSILLKILIAPYSYTIGRILKARAKAKWCAEIKEAKTVEDLIDFAMQRGYSYPIAWAEYQIVKRKENKERKMLERILQNRVTSAPSISRNR